MLQRMLPFLYSVAGDARKKLPPSSSVPAEFSSFRPIRAELNRDRFMRNREFDFIRSLVYERSRICLGAHQRELVPARLGKRLRATEASSMRRLLRTAPSPGSGGIRWMILSRSPRPSTLGSAVT